MDIYEFASKLAEQHANLLKVIELQNNSIQALNERLNAVGATQLVIFALLLDSDSAQRRKIAEHVRLMLENPNLTENQHLAGQLQELLNICQDSQPAEPTPKSTTPSWFQGVVQGGLSGKGKP